MDRLILIIFCLVVIPFSVANASENLIQDPSCELTKAPDQFGIPFVKWGGWKYEGEAEFAVGQVSHSGKNSCLLIGKSSPKIRLSQELELKPGRYRVTAFIRGLDIGVGQWNQTTEFMFNDKYIQLNKNGTFGWIKLTYVGEISEQKKVAVSFGLMAPGFLWIDDVSLEEVGNDVPLTVEPVIGAEEAPITPPGKITDGGILCPVCGHKNMPAWEHCYACGSHLEVKQSSAPRPPVKLITSFGDTNPFYGGNLVNAPFFQENKALQIDKYYVSLESPQDWSGYDYLKIDIYIEATESSNLDIEISDTATRDYWTRVNYTTVIPSGKSTLVLPLKQLYVGEKSRPGRMLNPGSIKKFVINIGDNPKAPIFLGKIWLENDQLTNKAQFDGILAFDFGPDRSPLMEGFTPISPTTSYTKDRGYGIKAINPLRAYNVLQPEPLYQDYICMESAGFAADVPSGKYRVFVNIDNPSGYWGEYQVYRNRSIKAQGKEVIHETMDFNLFQNKYYRFWDTEDLPTTNTFDKYQKTYFKEKIFDVDVTDGQLVLDFEGDPCATSVSAIIIYPLSKQAEGEQFLKWAEDKRRFYFDNFFKRTLHAPTGDALTPSPEEQQRGYIVFTRDIMNDVYYNDRPFKNEIGKTLTADSFAGQLESISFAILPILDLGEVTIKLTDLTGAAAIIPENAIEVGYVSNRISRATMDGSIYTIYPRIIIPRSTVDMPKDVTRRFWLTIKTPQDAKPGLYQGQVTILTKNGITSTVPIELRVRKGSLDPVDIPVGPFGYTINTPWFGDDPASKALNDDLALKSLMKLREYGFTMFSGVPTIRYNGFETGQPLLDFSAADVEMKLAKNLGFLAVNSYGAGLQGLNSYYQDIDQMNNAGFSTYSAFIKVIYSAIQKHADEHQWLPIYWNLADEPGGDDLERSITNAEAYRMAFPKGPPFFSGASSFKGNNQNDPLFILNKTFHVASLNLHDEAGINLLHQYGGEWGFYNKGTRWIYGEYMYKATKQFGMKFLLSWHWNISAGDPYYALDCREDDYAWCHAAPNAQLIREVDFERIASGLVDYRMLITLQRLANEHKGSPAATTAEALISTRLSAFRLGQTNHDEVYPLSDFSSFRKRIADAIEAFQQ